MKNLCIIPARGGSKRIPRKNIKPFMGKPIIAYSIEAALKSGLFDEVMVSTDDEEFAEVAKQFGAKVPFMRSAETANDFATTEDVLIEVLDNYKNLDQEFDNICCLYSTAPFVTSDRLKEAYEKMISDNVDAVFTVVAYSYPIQRCLHVVDGKISMKWPEYQSARSQDLETIYHDAGQFYFGRVEQLRIEKDLWMKNSEPLILPETEVQDLDTMTDWELAEMKFNLLKR
ncbi:MAG TPA: pseudaminic acid cytidylyltransferase [Bacteroides graminisolvens]|uniref:Pseudaminic acid cytidylyltransferase n=1 Tax=Bacteroides graminisolvens TaxID=477666 RepID=A0A3D2SFE0_9BACE|nr:pseudaminic acid cytidylyltransferase [Bacteroides graminisolvens]